MLAIPAVVTGSGAARVLVLAFNTFLVLWRHWNAAAWKRDGVSMDGWSRAEKAGAARALKRGLLDERAFLAGSALLTLDGRLLADAVVRDILP